MIDGVTRRVCFCEWWRAGEVLASPSGSMPPTASGPSGLQLPGSPGLRLPSPPAPRLHAALTGARVRRARAPMRLRGWGGGGGDLKPGTGAQAAGALPTPRPFGEQLIDAAAGRTGVLVTACANGNYHRCSRSFTCHPLPATSCPPPASRYCHIESSNP